VNAPSEPLRERFLKVSSDMWFIRFLDIRSRYSLNNCSDATGPLYYTAKIKTFEYYFLNLTTLKEYYCFVVARKFKMKAVLITINRQAANTE